MDAVLFCSLYNQLGLGTSGSARRESAAGRWFDRTAHALRANGLLAGTVSGLERIGAQIDNRPDCVTGAAAAVDATRRNVGLKKGASQRDKEKAAKEMDQKKKRHKSSESRPAAAQAAPAQPALNLSHEDAQTRLWKRLAEMGIIPYKEEDPNLEAVKPVGHTTHNLFVKDKKSKKMFLITALQDTKIDLKKLTKELGMKQLRMMRMDDAKNSSYVRRGCITALSLYNDVSAQITPVWDSKLLDQAMLRICAGCEDPSDHSQHNVVDIPLAKLQQLMSESGHSEIIFSDFA